MKIFVSVLPQAWPHKATFTKHVECENYFFLPLVALAKESAIIFLAIESALAVESAAIFNLAESTAGAIGAIAEESVLVESVLVSEDAPPPQAAKTPRAITNNTFFIVKRFFVFELPFIPATAKGNPAE